MIKMDISTADPTDIVNALREKLQLASGKLSKADIERLIPPSLKKRDQHNVAPYIPGTLRRQREEAQKFLNDKGRPGLKRTPIVHQEIQEEYLKKFFEAKALGKFAHLPNDDLVNLETEVRNSAADSTKHTELDEFLKSIEEETVVPEGEVNLKDLLEPFEDIPEPKKIDMVQAFSADEMPAYPRECPIDRVDSSLPVKEYIQPVETPIRLRKISETLEALVIATEFAEQNNCGHFIDHLDSFIAHLSCLTTANQDQICPSVEEKEELAIPSESSINHLTDTNSEDQEPNYAPSPVATVTENMPGSDSQMSFEQSKHNTSQSTPNMPMNGNIVMDNELPTKPAFITEADFESCLTENGSPLIEDEEEHIPPPPASSCVQHLVHRKMVMNNNTYNTKKNTRPVLRSETGM